ncbi:cupin domain-containing protein [Tautonia plasticadhaerens]|uniref:Cupin domain protein n=1 Tax=Tautonia plasticadhaerens TaxID=2527974 RepID=A0A518GXV5_9BACT|nr:cupin domain-containing protein [Tautonia plasticadhaerens]QDV33428.1 Cupin domain protein [Tautonia plasticadhaerens]
MARAALVLIVGILGVVGIAAARHDEDGESVRPVAAYDIAEMLDGKETTASVVEVTIEPGQAGLSHRHPGPGLGYVLEGEYEWAIDDQPAMILEAGETFYEPAGCLHRVSRNPGTVRTRLLAWVLHPRGVKDIAVPVKD